MGAPCCRAARFVRLLCVALVTLVVLARPLAAAEPPFEGLDAFVVETMAEWQVPGLALALVRDGEVVLARGYGYRDLARTLPVTPDTLFAVGSITKPFTVVGLAMLVDEGRLDWDAPVRDYLPAFRLADGFASETMTPRDLVTHRSGLPRHDALWYATGFDRDSLFGRLRYLDMGGSFRVGWGYQNLLFMVAGRIAERLSETTWEAFTRRRLLAPLGMTRSNFTVAEMQRDEDFASPHALVDDAVADVALFDMQGIGPAGALNASAAELIRFVRFAMNEDRHDGAPLLSQARMAEMQAPQTAMPGTPKDVELGRSSYGMGFVVSRYRGHTTISHGGGIDGYVAQLSFMPEHDIGLVVLSNLDRNPVPTIVARNLYDRLLGLEPIAWNARFREKRQKAEAASRDPEILVPRKENAPPSHPLADYVGTYEHPAYGRLRIARDGEALRWLFHRFDLPLRHFHYDMFEIEKIPLTAYRRLKVSFFYDKAGAIDRLAVPLEYTVDDIVFRRVAD